MTTKFLIATDAAATAFEDITDLVNWETAKFGGSAHRGEIFAANGFDLLDDAGTRTIPNYRVVMVVEDATTPDTVLFRGRTIGNRKGRGVIVTEPAKVFDVSLVDHNKDFGGIAFAGTSRPAETDVQRIRFLLDNHLEGQNRASTDLADTYFSSSNPISLVAHKYEGVQAIDWFNHIVESTGKQFFITVDSELFYDAVTSTAYAADLAITDVLPLAADEYFPVDPSAFEDGGEMYTRVRFRYSDGRIVTVVRSAVEAANDRWGTAIVDETAHSPTAATTRANKFLDEFDHTQITYSCSIDLHESEVDKIKYGQTVSFRSAACGVLTPETLRVGSLQWTKISADRYRANLELGYPTKFGKRAGGGQTAPVTGPVPFVPGGGFQYNVGGFVTGGAAASATLDAPAGTNSLLVVALSAEDDGAARALATAGYTLQQTALAHSSLARLLLYTKVAVGGEQTVSSNAVGGNCRLIIAEVPGTTGDTSEVDNGASNLTTFTADTLTPGAVGDRGIVLAFFNAYYQDYNIGSLNPVGALVEASETYGGIGRLVVWFGFIETDSLATTYAPAVTSTVRPSDNDAGNTWGSVAIAIVLDPDSEAVGSPTQGQLVTEGPFTADGTTTAGSPTNFPYAPGSLIVLVNGVDITESVTETDPTTGAYEFDNAPPVGAIIRLRYLGAAP
jgi:hypothetical protein